MSKVIIGRILPQKVFSIKGAGSNDVNRRFYARGARYCGRQSRFTVKDKNHSCTNESNC